MREIINQANYEPGRGRETNEQPSQTIPGETRTIKEIVARYRQSGELPTQEGDAVYFDVDDVNQINKYFQPGQLDLTDLEQLRDQNNEMKKIIEEAEERKKNDEAAAKKQAEIEAKAKELNESKEQNDSEAE